MDRLSSCYFCGDALDATLEEHPVVPPTLNPDPDTQKSVVLCATCRRKLEAVLETVVEAVDAPTDDSSTDASDDVGASDGATADDLESTLGDDEEILTPLGGDDSAADDGADPAEASETEFGGNRAAAEESEGETESSNESGAKSSKYTDSRGAGFRRDDGSVESGSLTGGAFSGDDDESAESESLTGGAFDDDDEDDQTESTTPDSDAEDTDSGGRSGGPSSGQRDTAATDESPSAEPDRDVSMSRLENTKVMRLLENREFPVEKDEFVTVAANAYQISREDCEKVLTLAVEHGLLREDDGRLYDGDA